MKPTRWSLRLLDYGRAITWDGGRLLVLLGMAWGAGSLEARDFRVNQIPNGHVNSCANCHVSAGGGGTRNPFGNAVFARTGGSSAAFWSLALATLDSDGDGFTNGEELGDPDGDGQAVPGAPVTNPGVAASRPNPAPVEIDLLEVVLAGAGSRMEWTGGLGAGYLIQRGSALTDGPWVNLLTLNGREAVVPGVGEAGFFRVVDRPTNTVHAFTVWLAGDNVLPAVETAAKGFGFLSLEGNNLTYRIDYSGLEAATAGAQLQGPALTTGTGAVLHALEGAQGISGALAGQLTLAGAAQRGDVLGGRTYVTLSTEAQPEGELRGQVAPLRWSAELRGSQEVPPVVTTGQGRADIYLVGNELTWALTYSGLGSEAALAQIHAPAGVGENADAIVTMAEVMGTGGSARGSVVLSLAQLRQLIDGLAYVNVLTTGHPTGEIRGQILPTP
jgi:hypothetical protein